MFEVRIKEMGRVTTYYTAKGETKEECFDNIYSYFKAHKYCWQVTREIEDPVIKEEYYKWKSSNNEGLFWKHASGRDLD